VVALQQTVDTLSDTPQAASLDVEFAQIDSSLSSLDSRLQRIERAILDDPVKVLEVTLLRRDIEDIQQKYPGDLQSVREEIARLYEFNKWFLGVVIFGLLGIAASNFLPGLRKAGKDETRPDKTDRGDTECQ